MNEFDGPEFPRAATTTGRRRRGRLAVSAVAAAGTLVGAAAMIAPPASADGADRADAPAAAAPAAAAPSADASSADAAAARLATAEPVEIRATAEVAEGLPDLAATTAFASQTDRLGAAVVRDVLDQTLESFAANEVDSLAAIADADRQLVVDIQRAGDGWAEGVAFISAPLGEHGGAEGWLYMAEYEGGAWTIGLEGDAEFADHVTNSPLLDEREREVFEGYVGTTDVKPLAVTGLQLPFPTYTSQMLAGGPHGWSGQARPWSAVDISGGNGDVRAARAGTARSICNGWTRIIHDNGYSTDYYHLSNFQWASGWVGTNAYLGEHGMTLCAGGSALGPHVHFAIRQYDANLNGWYVPLNGNRIGGWWFWEGASAYAGYAYNESNGYAYPGNWMYNFGL